MKIEELWPQLEAARAAAAGRRRASGWVLRQLRPEPACPLYAAVELSTGRRGLLLRFHPDGQRLDVRRERVRHVRRQLALNGFPDLMLSPPPHHSNEHRQHKRDEPDIALGFHVGSLAGWSWAIIA